MTPVKRFACKDFERVVRIGASWQIGLYMKGSKKRYLFECGNQTQFETWIDTFNKIIQFHSGEKPPEMEIHVYFADGSNVPVTIEYGETTAEQVCGL